VLWRTPRWRPQRPIATQDVALDAAARHARRCRAGRARPARSRSTAELAFRDPSGETQTSRRACRLAVEPHRRARQRKFGGRDRVELAGAVLDTEGRPVRLARADVECLRAQELLARKRMVGASTPTSRSRRYPDRHFCSARTTAAGRFSCEGAPPRTGNLVFVARTSGLALPRERPRTSTCGVPGDDQAWFAQGDGDRMELLPGAAALRARRRARFQVRMPIRTATALGPSSVRRRREHRRDDRRQGPGRLRADHRRLRAERLRVGARVRAARRKPQPTGLVDLAKPSYRLGIAELRVGWRDRSLAVRVEPEQPTYRVARDARVAIARPHARRRRAAARRRGRDQRRRRGLLQLAPNRELEAPRTR
jgi:hypothetical protein